MSHEQQYICIRLFSIYNDLDGFEVEKPLDIEKGTVWTANEDQII